jgi:hypothetical protein
MELKDLKIGDNVFHELCGEGNVVEILGDMIRIKFIKNPPLMFNACVNPALINYKSLTNIDKLKKFVDEAFPRKGSSQSIGDLGDEDLDIDWETIQVSSKQMQSFGN